jgi:hypothetical protein
VSRVRCIVIALCIAPFSQSSSRQTLTKIDDSIRTGRRRARCRPPMNAPPLGKGIVDATLKCPWDADAACHWPRVTHSLRRHNEKQLASRACSSFAHKKSLSLEALQLQMRKYQAKMHPSTLQLREGMASKAELESWLQVAETFAGEAHTVCEIGLNGGDSAAAWLCSFPRASYVSFDLARFNVTTDAADFLSTAFPGRFTLVRGSTLATLPQYARAHPRSCDIMIVDGGHSLEVGYSDLSYMRMLARDPTRHVVVMDDVRCAAWWCHSPTIAWSYLVQEGVIREEGCLNDACCSGWCWARYDLTAPQPAASGICGPPGIEHHRNTSTFMRRFVPHCRASAKRKFPNSSSIRIAREGAGHDDRSSLPGEVDVVNRQVT